MASKRIKRVIVIGAGFSAPAKIPIQNKIIEKMIEEPDYDFLSGTFPRESIKFLNAYIKVGLFLLNNYGKGDYYQLAESYDQLIYQKQAINIFLNTMHFSQNVKSEIAHKLKIDKDGYYSALYNYKEYILLLIKREGISVNLEDIFTSFDKSVNAREHIHKYTYTQMDEIRYSIMRLFIYYFSKSVQEHSFMQEDYIRFFRYIKTRKTKNPTTIITTNWATLIEEYCKRNKISYDYGFNMPYTNMQNNICKSDILLLKIHGYINWLKCLHCGAISVFDKGKVHISAASGH